MEMEHSKIFARIPQFPCYDPDAEESQKNGEVHV